MGEKGINNAKTWTISWNADSGSVEDISANEKRQYHHKQQREGLFRCQYESETTLSSDYHSTNSEMSQCDANAVTDDNTENNKSISTVHEASHSSMNSSIKSEASWRRKGNKQNVCKWLKQCHFSRTVCSMFWEQGIDGNKLLTLSSDSLLQMFDGTNKEELKNLILCVTRIQIIHSQQ